MNITMRTVAPEDYAFLYQVMRERMEEPTTNISHTAMPTHDEHVSFLSSQPYSAHYIVELNGFDVGVGYLTKADEIGVYIKPDYRGQGVGKKTVVAVMLMNPRKRYLANINPLNERSKKLFAGMGFGLLQETYELKIGRENV